MIVINILQLQERNIHIIKLLLVFGANVNSMDNNFRTPLDKAMEYKLDNAIALLKSVGALEGKAARNRNTFASLPRLKAFHNTFKAMERLKDLRMKSLSAMRRIDNFDSKEECGAEQSSGNLKMEAVDGSGGEVAVPDAGKKPLNMARRMMKIAGMRERTLTNQSLDNATLSDMEDGNTLLYLSQRLEQYINIKLDLSSKYLMYTMTLVSVVT